MLRLPRTVGAVLVSVLLAGSGVALAASFGGSSSHTVPTADLPDAKLTPGSALPVGGSRVCRSGYTASVRAVPAAELRQVAARYHARDVPRAHVVDQLISAGLGGSNAIGNLWLEPASGQWGAPAKNRLEARLHALVCAGSLSLKRAQHALSADWVAAYATYLGRAGAPMIPATSTGDTSITITTPTSTAVVPVTTGVMSPMTS